MRITTGSIRLSDAYIKMNGAHCCSRMEWSDNVKYAKINCAKNKKCIGIEIGDYPYVGICIDEACTDRDMNGDGDGNILFLKKKERYGKFQLMIYL